MSEIQIFLSKGTIKVAIVAMLMICRRLESAKTVKIGVVSAQETTQ